MKPVRLRHILAISLVLTALCADRIAAAAEPVLRPQISEVTKRIAVRVTASFRRVVPAARVSPDRREGAPEPCVPPMVVEGVVGVHAVEVTPFLFRLPPPTA